jgi:hypothetical protein
MSDCSYHRHWSGFLFTRRRRRNENRRGKLRQGLDEIPRCVEDLGDIRRKMHSDRWGHATAIWDHRTEPGRGSAMRGMTMKSREM